MIGERVGVARHVEVEHLIESGMMNQGWLIGSREIFESKVQFNARLGVL